MLHSKASKFAILAAVSLLGQTTDGSANSPCDSFYICATAGIGGRRVARRSRTS
jgi:hypothetical protein